MDRKVSNRGVRKCEPKLCAESRCQRHTPLPSRECAVLQPSAAAEEEAGRKGRQSTAYVSLVIAVCLELRGECWNLLLTVTEIIAWRSIAGFKC